MSLKSSAHDLLHGSSRRVVGSTMRSLGLCTLKLGARKVSVHTPASVEELLPCLETSELELQGKAWRSACCSGGIPVALPPTLPLLEACEVAVS